MEYLTKFDKLLKNLIVLAIIATAVGLFFPMTSTSFGPYYGSIAKHIAQTNDWTDLVLSNQDWLDKPHFPFWISALSFKLFGINSFAYILPGFLFHLLGAVYTYRLSNLLYKNNTVSLLATLIYLSVFHLMFSANDIRAEAYLLGQIMPAVYYWLRYDRKFSWSSLILGAFFTALALMTKGVFVVITIVSGLFCVWVYTKRLVNVIHPKWIGALVLSFILALPEVIALYIQFDLHPEKIIFGHNHVSGIRWFFVDSQFGRFFNTGYIYSTNPPAFHQVFFVHTFLWAFLPWSLVYPTAMYSLIRKFKTLTGNDKQALIFLLGYFWVSFVMFSVTSFQVDHYTNIIFPFAAILSAKFLYDLRTTNHKIFAVQSYLGIIMLALLAVVIGAVFKGWMLGLFVVLELLLVIYVIKNFGQIPFVKAILIPTLAICLTMAIYATLIGKIYAKYDSGILAAQITSNHPEIAIVDYRFDSRTLEFYVHNQYFKSDSPDQNPALKSYYLVTSDKVWQEQKAQFPNAQIVAEVQGNTSDKILPNLWSNAKLQENLERYDIILVNN
jgi:4-amino-4-deoxy-L-arabinose transferase-like glycosyltransferase